MPDIELQCSACRLRFTPTNDPGTTVELLPLGALCDNQPEKTGQPATQADNTIGAGWQTHHSRGNATAHLRGDAYKWAPSHYHAQKLREELWFYLMEHPEGVLDYATAFDENIHPIFTKKLHATLADFRADLLTDDTSPWPNAQGVHFVFSFQFSPIE